MSAGSGDQGSRRAAVPLLAVLLTALTLAALGGGFGGWLGWRAAPPLPRDAAAAALARLLVPRGTPLVIERHDMVFGYEHPGSAARVVGSSTYTGGYVKLLVTDAGDASTLLSDVRDQMGLAGWRINGNLVGAGTAGIKGRLAVSVYPATVTGQRMTQAHPNDDVAVEISRSEPARVPPFTIIGYLLGLALGWFGGGWLARRMYQDGQVRQRLAVAVGAVALLLLLPGTVLTTGDLLYAFLLAPGSVPAPPAWGQYLLPGVRGLATTGLVLFPIVLLLSVVPAGLRAGVRGLP